jgi:hypothetical protein
MAWDPFDDWEPREPGLVVMLLEDLLEFGVAVLNKTSVGAPTRQEVAIANPADANCDSIVAYAGTWLPFPDFQRSDKPSQSLDPKVAIFLRWLRCVDNIEGDEPLNNTADARLLAEDAFRMVISYAQCVGPKRNTLFRRYDLKQVEHVKLNQLKPVLQASQIAGWELAIEVQLNAFRVRNV